MLVHIKQTAVAERVHNAWLRTIEDGIHTYDIYVEGVSKQKVGTREFADAVIERLGQKPQTLKVVSYKSGSETSTARNRQERPQSKKELVGADVYVNWQEGTADKLGDAIKNLGDKEGLKLIMISNRGAKVYPNGLPETHLSDQYRCRYMAQADGAVVKHEQIITLLNRFNDAGYDFIKTENLYTFDGQAGYSLAAGQ